MAIFHFNLSIISRGRGQSSLDIAARRSGSVLFDERIGTMFKAESADGQLIFSTVFLTQYAPERFLDRQTLWNEVEKIEKRKDAQLARQVRIALPKELNNKQQICLLEEFATQTFLSMGIIVDLNFWLHANDNPYAYLLLMTRKYEQEGFGLKERDWNARSQTVLWREAWAKTVNKHLSLAGLTLTIDHRSLAAQGINRVAQRHVGSAALNMARRVSKAKNIILSLQ